MQMYYTKHLALSGNSFSAHPFKNRTHVRRRKNHGKSHGEAVGEFSAGENFSKHHLLGYDILRITFSKCENIFNRCIYNPLDSFLGIKSTVRSNNHIP